MGVTPAFICANHIILSCLCLVIINCLQKVLQKTETVCAGHERKREVYVSASNKMEVRLVVKRPDLLGYFLLKYEGNAYIADI